MPCRSIFLAGLLLLAAAFGEPSLVTRLGFGANFAVGENTDDALPSDIGWGGSVGVGLERKLFGEHSAVVGVNLKYRDFRTHEEIASSDGSFDEDEIVSQLELGIPVLWKVHLGERFALHAGILPGVQILSEHYDLIEDDWKSVSSARRFFLEAVCGAGVSLPWNLALDLSAGLTATDLFHSESQNVHARILRFELGISRGWGL